MDELSDADIGFLCRCLWTSGGGARGSAASAKRLLKAGLAVEKGYNGAAVNEQIYGPRLNITDAGRLYLLKGGK